MNTFDTAQTVDALTEMRRTRFLIAYLLAAICGLRRGEIAALRWKNVDLDTCVLKIVQTTRQIKTVVSYKPVKNTKGRPVALSGIMLEELKAHRARQAEELLRLGLKVTGDSFVFAQPDGARSSPAASPTNGSGWSPSTPCPAFGFMICGTPMPPRCWRAASIQRSPVNGWAIPR